jgi:hypothetical protein
VPKRITKSTFSVAMSQETGCIVMVRTLGAQAIVIGSLTKEQSDAFARGVLDWRAAPLENRMAYPH